MNVEEALAKIDAAPVPELPRRHGMRPLYIYGKGKLGKLGRDFFTHIGETISYQFEWGDPIPVNTHSGVLRPDLAQVAVCITTSPYAPIREKLKERGFDDVVPFYDLAQTMRGNHPLSNGWIAPPLTEEDRKSIRCVFSEWGDDTSRAHYLRFLAWRIAREEWVHDEVPEPVLADQHFIPEVVAVLHDHEVFIDGGAYHGEASGKFATLVRNSHRAIYAFEPDRSNYATLSLNWKMNNIRRMSLSWEALAQEDGTAKFADGFGFCSKLSDTGNKHVTTRSIDSLDLAPTFIKLHLEGGELAALKGAEQTLLKCRPIVAANVDHNEDGLWRTTAYLMGLLEDYTFLFRNHVWCAAGSVVYAIPNERRQ